MSSNKSERMQVVRDYLSNEGFNPIATDEGDLLFQCAEDCYYIILEEDDPDYYRLCYPNFWPIGNDAERAQVLRAAVAATAQTKVAKVYAVQDAVWASIELFLGSADQLNLVLKRSLSALQAAVRNFHQELSA
jgi:hypothetical protein